MFRLLAREKKRPRPVGGDDVREFAISTFIARYGRYISVRQVVGTRTAHYRAVPPKIDRLRSIEGTNQPPTVD
ncbi:hypothetical protein BHM03_00018663 [Ensete ventricosum]|nr:hypothetical protein BHM03_00018663 [Ensete ventricosum]